jgi:hypothetical protein
MGVYGVKVEACELTSAEQLYRMSRMGFGYMVCINIRAMSIEECPLVQYQVILADLG